MKIRSFLKRQFGFRSKHSTAQSLISLTEKIWHTKDVKKLILSHYGSLWVILVRCHYGSFWLIPCFSTTVLFRHHNKKINYDLKIKLNGKRLHYISHVIDEHFSWTSAELLSFKTSQR